MTSASNKTLIAELVSRYCRALDERDAEGVANCFVDDGQLVIKGKVHATGRAEFIDMIARDPDKKYRHFCSNVVVEGDDAAALSKAYVMVFDTETSLGAPYVLNEYQDQVVNSGGEWKIRHREVKVLIGVARAVEQQK